MYTVNHLSFDYPTRSVLHDISVEFPSNKITAIILMDVENQHY